MIGIFVGIILNIIALLVTLYASSDTRNAIYSGNNNYLISAFKIIEKIIPIPPVEQIKPPEIPVDDKSKIDSFLAQYNDEGNHIDHRNAYLYIVDVEAVYKAAKPKINSGVAMGSFMLLKLCTIALFFLFIYLIGAGNVILAFIVFPAIGLSFFALYRLHLSWVGLFTLENYSTFKATFTDSYTLVEYGPKAWIHKNEAEWRFFSHFGTYDVGFGVSNSQGKKLYMRYPKFQYASLSRYFDIENIVAELNDIRKKQKANWLLNDNDYSS